MHIWIPEQASRPHPVTIEQPLHIQGQLSLSLPPSNSDMEDLRQHQRKSSSKNTMNYKIDMVENCHTPSRTRTRSKSMSFDLKRELKG